MERFERALFSTVLCLVLSVSSMASTAHASSSISQSLPVIITGQGMALQQATPVAVSVDIKPRSCPNPLNVRGKGKLPVAVLGSNEFNVTTVDIASILLEGVWPIHSAYEDVATPLPDGSESCDCTEEGPDGYLDLTLTFEVFDILSALGQVSDGDMIPLNLTGTTLDGSPIEGSDCVVIRAKGGKAD